MQDNPIVSAVAGFKRVWKVTQVDLNSKNGPSRCASNARSRFGPVRSAPPGCRSAVTRNGAGGIWTAASSRPSWSARCHASIARAWQPDGTGTLGRTLWPLHRPVRTPRHCPDAGMLDQRGLRDPGDQLDEADGIKQRAVRRGLARKQAQPLPGWGWMKRRLATATNTSPWWRGWTPASRRRWNMWATSEAGKAWTPSGRASPPAN